MKRTTLALLLPAVDAVDIYGQCGGQNYGGSTSCAIGLYCSSQNPYYFQCVPATTTLSTRTTSTSRPPITTSTSTGGGGTTNPPVTTTTSADSGGSPSNVAGNIFAGKQIYANPYYASEISAYALPSLTGALKVKASAVANTGTFVWLDTAAKVPTMDTYLTNIEALNKAGANPPIIGAFVVYDLPNRDCAALASNGEYLVANNGLAKYYAYVDSIAAILKKHSSTPVALVIEPDSLGNLITNLNVAKCAEAQPAYESGVEYAMKTLNLPNVAMYLDAGHAGWLGWTANLTPSAQLFTRLFKAAGSPKAVRGLVTNVSNYNGFNTSSAPSYTQGNANYNEKLYINAIAPLLTQDGFPAHFITDVGRNGVQPTKQQAWGDWCNVIGTGFGKQPTTSTGDPLVDALVWVKPGGESDGTSNSSSVRYDAHCGYADALQPAPEAGTWFQAYFEQILRNAAF